MATAAIYARISADPEGRALGVARQLEDCRALAARLGYDVVQEYTENDVSASTNTRKARPLYDEMLRRAAAGEFTALVAYSNSRFTRRPRELEDLIELHRQHGTRLHTVVSGEDDLSTADGRMVARIKGNVDAAEAERTSERVRRAKLQTAADGRHRGGPRPFGWEKDGMTVREDEAAAVLQASRDVLAGRTLAAIARDWNAAGSTTTTGRPWTYGALRTVLCRPRNAALVSHGKSDREGMTVVGQAKWPAIVPEDVWRATRAVLMDPSRRRQNGNDLRWLGSGLYVCGVCAAEGVRSTLRVAPYERSKYLYRCVRAAHLTVSQPMADAVVLGVVRRYLAEAPGLAEAIQTPDPSQAERKALTGKREALTARLVSFEDDYGAGLISGRQLADATRRVEAELEQVNRTLARLAGASPLAALAGAPDPVAAFDAAPLDVQRAVVTELLTVTVQRVGRGRPTGPERVQITWK